MLNRTLIKQLLPITLLAVVLLIAYLLSSGPSVTGSKQCQLEQNSCEFRLADDSIFSATFKTYPLQIEENNSVQFNIPNNYEFRGAWVEGINMFMGKMRVIENHKVETVDSVEVDATTFLGACSEPEMRWRMVVELENKKAQLNKDRKQRYFINFNTTL